MKLLYQQHSHSIFKSYFLIKCHCIWVKLWLLFIINTSELPVIVGIQFFFLVFIKNKANRPVLDKTCARKRNVELLKHVIVFLIHIHNFYYGLWVHDSVPLLPCGLWRRNHRTFRREIWTMQMMFIEILLLHLNTSLIIFMRMYHTKSWLWTLKNDNLKREFYFGQKKFRKKDLLTFLFTLIEYACIIYKIAYIIYLKLSIY